MKKIKILFAIGRLSVGGAEKLLIHQLKNIEQEIFEPHLLTLFDEQKESLACEVPLLSKNWRRFNFKGLFDIVSWFRLWRYLKKEKFEIAVTSLFSANLIVRIAAIFAGVPVIISYEHNLYPNKHKWQIFMDRILARFTKKILVDAESVKKFTARQENIPEEKFLVFYHPPLLEGSEPRPKKEVQKELGLNPDFKVVLTVSRLAEEKGHKYLIEAAEKVLEKFPNTYFLIVGWGPEEKNLKSQIFHPAFRERRGKNLKIQDRVILTGRKDIADMLPLADIYVEPAVLVDISIALEEAMESGKAVVASQVGEIPVFIKDGINGFLVEPKNADDLAEKIIRLLESEELRKALGDEARKDIAGFSIKSYMRKFEELILSLVNQYGN